ncbi:hypothetical protein BsWGS_02254 [Bradybaena similaris]
MECAWKTHRSILNWFYDYGYYLATHPLYFLITPLVICGLLSLGLLNIKTLKGDEYLYAPYDSRSLEDREIVRHTFIDMSDTNFSPFSSNEIVLESKIIFRSKKAKSILTEEVMKELESFYRDVISMVVQTDDGRSLNYSNVCKKQRDNCVIKGDFIFADAFLEHVKAGRVSFPYTSDQSESDLGLVFSRVDVNSDSILLAVGSFKIAFPVIESPDAEIWEHGFAEHVRKTQFTTVDIAYSTSDSLYEELDSGAKGDVVYFILTFIFMSIFTTVVCTGGDCVSSRILLANAGVIAVGFGIMGASGLVSLCGVEFINFFALMPLLTLGIGMDNMFLLMSSWSETLPLTDLTIPERIGLVFKKAAIGITISSATDFLSFTIGTFSRFRSVRNFCIYSAVGTLASYICNACVFGACMTFHAHRVYASRHVFTCQKVSKSREQLIEEGAPLYTVFLCGGEIPTTAKADQSVCERGPKRRLVRMLLYHPVRYFTLLLFSVYLAVAIWGCTELQQDLEQKNLLRKSSYFYKFQTWDEEDYGVRLIISFVSTETKDYWKPEALQEMKDLIEKAQEDPKIVPRVSICWLLSLAKSPLYNTTSREDFYLQLLRFLHYNPSFQNDIRFGANKTITGTRCHVYSYKLREPSERAGLMVRMRQFADASSAHVFAYHPLFVMYEQYLVIVQDTIMNVLVTIAVMLFVTSIFLPHPVIVLIVMIQLMMIITGVFGFMAHWGLTLSAITMIELVMSVGFSVDFCAHVCTAYMVSDEHSRIGRSRDAIIHASGPIFNGGMSSIIGVLMLAFTESYIFQSFFKITFLVICFGVLHAVILVPVILSFIGPGTRVDLDLVWNDRPSLTEPITAASSHGFYKKRKSKRGIKVKNSDKSNKVVRKTSSKKVKIKKKKKKKKQIESEQPSFANLSR